MPLYISEGGPTTDRGKAVEFSADVVERRRLGAEYVFDLPFEATLVEGDRDVAVDAKLKVKGETRA